MKKLILIATTSILVSTSAYAGQQNSIGGLVIGAGSGALMGQAIGRDTESTLVGTAVGGVIGYIIGNEMDKDSRVYYRPAPPRPVPHRPVVYKEKYVTQNHYYYGKSKPVYHTRNSRCKEAEILGTVNGRAKKIYGTVCRTGQGWELVSENPYDRDRYSHKNYRPGKGLKKGHYRDRGHEHWAGHRF